MRSAGRSIAAGPTTGPVPAWREYLGWLPYLARRHRAHRRGRGSRGPLPARDGKPFTLVALQMETDYQVRVSSDFAGQAADARAGACSPSRAARSAEHRLVVKIHPLDNGLIDWRGVVAGPRPARFGVEGRVDVIRGGRLDVPCSSGRMGW